MSTQKTEPDQKVRRGELMAELFLQDLEPEFVARPTADMGFDYLVGFVNKEGGINTYAIEVKATEEPVREAYRLPRRAFNRLAHSNIPLLLLVADVKRNELFYAWLSPNMDPAPTGNTVQIALAPVTRDSRAELRHRMAGSTET